MKKEEEFDKEGQLVKTTIVTEAKVEKSKYNKAADWIDLIVKSASIFTIALALLTYFDSLSESNKKEQQQVLQNTRDSLSYAYKQLRDIKGDSLADIKFRHEQFAFDTTFKMEQLRFLSQQASETKRQADEQKRFNESIAASINGAEKARLEDRKNQIAEVQLNQFIKIIKSVTSIMNYEYNSADYIRERNNLFGSEYGALLVMNDSEVNYQIDKMKKQIEFYESLNRIVSITEKLPDLITDIDMFFNQNYMGKFKKTMPQKFQGNYKHNRDSLHHYLTISSTYSYALEDEVQITKDLNSDLVKYSNLEIDSNVVTPHKIVACVDSIISENKSFVKKTYKLLSDMNSSKEYNKGSLHWFGEMGRIMGLSSFIDKQSSWLETILPYIKNSFEKNSHDIALTMTNSNLFLTLKKNSSTY